MRSICFCADKNYLRFVVPAIESIELSNEEAGFKYHIISDVPMSIELSGLFSLFLDVDSKIIWHEIDVLQFLGLKEVMHFTKAMYYRLCIPDLIFEEKVLYLDCDVLVRKSLNSLFELDLSNFFVGAVINPFFSRTHLVAASDYFNSGVMLINCDKWRVDKVKDRVIDILKTRADVLEMPDQDALNVVINGNWLRLDWSYNSQMSVYTARDRGFFPESASDPTIVHFSATNKQWHKSCGLIFADEYERLSTAITIFKRNLYVDFCSVVFRFLVAKISGAGKYFYIRK